MPLLTIKTFITVPLRAAQEQHHEGEAHLSFEPSGVACNLDWRRSREVISHADSNKKTLIFTPWS
jgi:hypothetical protein